MSCIPCLLFPTLPLDRAVPALVTAAAALGRPGGAALAGRVSGVVLVVWGWRVARRRWVPPVDAGTVSSAAGPAPAGGAPPAGGPATD
jgi:hypothetical protein